MLCPVVIAGFSENVHDINWHQMVMLVRLCEQPSALATSELLDVFLRILT